MSNLGPRFMAYARRSLYYEPWLTATAVITTVALAMASARELKDHTWGYDRKIHGYVNLERGTEQLLRHNNAVSPADYMVQKIWEPQEGASWTGKKKQSDDAKDDSSKKDDE